MMQRGWAIMGKLLVSIAVILVVLAAVPLILALRSGVSAQTEPTAMEAMIAAAARHFAIPASARNMRNPVPLTAAAVAEGRDHFADHCAMCHANDGSGKTDIGTSLYPKAPDMRTPHTQNLSDGELFYIIKNGVRLTGMPAWAGDHHDDDNWELVHFIRHLPKITPEEIEQMKRMNPISPHDMQEKKEDEEFLKGDHKHEGH
jgi:mono/diheme cytochrome c family protein